MNPLQIFGAMQLVGVRNTNIRITGGNYETEIIYLQDNVFIDGVGSQVFGQSQVHKQQI